MANSRIASVAIAVSIIISSAILVFALMEREQSTSNISPIKHSTTNNGTLKTERCAEDYVGLPIDQAADSARENGLTPKTIKRDGKAQGFTDEGSASIYFEVENGTVTKAYFEDNRP